ncbi:MAG: hypothetical protein M0P58_10890 [Bacteroidales bacterium]|nr:hypothetical protein [Bacteroidales bacterium]
MRFLEKFSTNISEFFPHFRGLNKGFAMLDENSQEEVRMWIISQQNGMGGFPDRGSKCDLYYTLFGFFLADALKLDTAMNKLKSYINIIEQQPVQSNIELFCLAILHASLFPHDAGTDSYIRKIRKISKNGKALKDNYSSFLIILSLFYLRDYTGAVGMLKSLAHKNGETATGETGDSKPAPVIAAQQILLFMKSMLPSGMKSNSFSGSWDNGAKPAKILSFYNGNGGFSATTDAPGPDLLSTAVALFTLKFIGYDLGLLRPDCLNFVGELYQDGGFRSCALDNKTDVEYTFYGLLALGSLAQELK